MTKKMYKNINQHYIQPSFKMVWHWQKERQTKKKDFSYQVPVTATPEIDFIHSNQSKPTITWIGHSTFFIQINGKNILTDPVWAKRLSFFKRLSPPGINLDELPPIDYVLISHNHYDHLHLASIKKLKGNPIFLVPAGLGRWFVRRGFKETAMFDWWGSLNQDGMRLTFVPAEHWSRRTMTDTNRSHWGGWVIECDGQPTIYFAGDSGYFEGFRSIGEHFDIDYSLMPIGSYEPEWFMGPQHVTPRDAVRAYLESGGKFMIPMHYGAFYLSDETPKEALDAMYTAWSEERLDPGRLLVPKLGETIRI